jgi:hypothetical protein
VWNESFASFPHFNIANFFGWVKDDVNGISSTSDFCFFITTLILEFVPLPTLLSPVLNYLSKSPDVVISGANDRSL